ncbi:MAG: hypothetical protein PHG03_04860 [Bacilli bacterium]|nr:hypothetical protein [Bacilli bacterium]
MSKKIYLDKDGYQQYLNAITELHDKLKTNSFQKSEAYISSTGNGWHDNYEFEESKRIENGLITQINNMNQNLNKIEIIKSDKADSSIVNLNDIIEVQFLINNNNNTDIFKLTGNYFTKDDSEYDELTLNSPVGNAIYHQKIGSIVEYNVESNIYKLKIVRKVGG